MAKGARNIVLDLGLDCSAGTGVDLRCIFVLEPIEGSRGPAIIAFKADLARSDRARRWRRINRDRLSAGQNAVPEILFGIEELDLVQPVGGDLENLELLVAEDHRQHCLLAAG